MLRATSSPTPTGRSGRPGKKREQPALAQVIVTSAPMKKKLGPVIRLGAECPAEPQPKRAAIVTAQKKASLFGDVPDMTPEEHKRRGDAADALTGSTGAGSTSLTKGETT